MTQKLRTKENLIKDYQQNIDQNKLVIQKIKTERINISIVRLLVVLICISFCWYLWPAATPVFLTIILAGIIFTRLVFRDVDKLSAMKNHERLIKINQHELDVIKLNLAGYDEGKSFSDPLHAYSSDLDLFGASSVYQWLSRCHADQSKKLLADRLKAPLLIGQIRNSQAAAKELSGKQTSCQQFQSYAVENPLSFSTEKKLKDWTASPSAGFEKSYWTWIQNIYPVVPITIFTLYLLDDISSRAFVFCGVVFYIMYLVLGRKISPEFAKLSKIESEVEGIYLQLLHIENEKFDTELLRSLQVRLNPSSHHPASAVIKDFHGILKKIEYRSNLVVAPFLQFFLIWDIRQILSLNKWKRKNKIQINEWFGVIAEMEVAITLASLVYNEPGWCFPDVDENYFHFKAEKIGHPLIPEEVRVTNDFELNGIGKMALITGSNMAGKSTFLRSLGVNTVLALMGSPVCADKMNICNMTLISSMRVADNLAENTSTFYAELKKIQFIIESINRREHAFILLDEVLRGTNSTDRHKGSKALVKQLLKEKAVAVMATHDTDLAHAESADEAVYNYHFEGKVVADELYFDYKIKKGICESLNATTLMKKIGIHFQD
jgi:MutS domain V